MIEYLLLSKKIKGWSSLRTEEKEKLMSRSRYEFYVRNENNTIYTIIPFVLIFSIGLIISLIIVINYYYLSGVYVFIFFGCSFVLFIGIEIINLVRVIPLIPEIEKNMEINCIEKSE